MAASNCMFLSAFSQVLLDSKVKLMGWTNKFTVKECVGLLNMLN